MITNRVARQSKTAAFFLAATICVCLCTTPLALNAQCGNCQRILVCTEGYAFNMDTCQCEPSSPIIIDVTGHGFQLTSASAGVLFDINGDGIKEQIAWTHASASNAFLVLDRNHNGVIDNGLELFGNSTPQPSSPIKNGFLALAEYDKPENGGNGDGVIDEKDAIFSQLRLWIDANHNGISEPDELFSLKAKGVKSISVSYKQSNRTDEFGNVFRYRAPVRWLSTDNTTTWAYDVFLSAL